MPHALHHGTSHRRQWLRAVGVGLGVTVVAAMSGCGFALRQSPKLAFQSLYINVADGSLFGQLLKRNLKSIDGLEVITEAREIERAEVILELLLELPEKVILSRTATGTVREYVLRLRVRFRLRARNGDELIPDTELLQEREISFNETAALAKESEEQLLYRDMRADLIQQLIRRLTAVRQI